MEDFFSSIGVCTIIIGVIYLLIRSSERKEDKEKENEDLFKYTYRSEENFDKTISRAKNIEKVLSQPSVRREAEERRKKGQEIMAADEDRRRKDKILKRTYSYQYEDVIYEIFSPLAVQEENSWMAKKYGKWRLHKSIDKFFFQSEIARILRMSEDEASKLMLREDIQKKIEDMRKPLEKAAQQQALTEREKKRAWLWNMIENAQNDSDRIRAMDILNKMDSEYINIQRIEKDETPITELDTNKLIELTKIS